MNFADHWDRRSFLRAMGMAMAGISGSRLAGAGAVPPKTEE
jgi:hypothetical protein